MFRRCFFIILILLPLFVRSASTHDYSFSHIGVKEGLSNGFVLDIAIDNQGFVWSATESGLNRLAGNTNIVFRKSNSDLASDVITALYFDKSKNKLWIATQQDGVSVYDCSSGLFENFNTQNGLASNEISDIAHAADGGVWILHKNGPFQHFNYSDRRFKTYLKKSKIQNRTILDDGGRFLFIGHIKDGLTVIDLQNHNARHYSYNPKDPASIPGNNVRAIFVDKKRNVWIGTNNGVGLFSIIDGTTICYREGLAGNNIHSIFESENGELWISSDLGGISILDLSTFKGLEGEHIEFRRLTIENSGLSSPNVRNVLQDKYGNMWIANYSTGLDFISNRPSLFDIIPFYSEYQGKRTLKRIYGITSDRRGNIWLGGENELSLVNDNKIIKSWDVIPHGTRSESVIYTVFCDSNGKIWMGINDAGVMVFDPQTESIKEIDLKEEFLDIHAFYEDSDGIVWIGSENGVFKYDHGKVEKVNKINDQLESKTIYALYKDEQNSLWIGTLGGEGLQVFDSHFKELPKIAGLPSKNINHIMPVNGNGLWIATYNGLVHYQNGKVSVFNEKQGLNDNHVRAVTYDRRGNIWLSTYSGVSSLNISTNKIFNYDFQEGVPIGSFAESAVTTTGDGTIYFASPNGVCFFNPQLLDDNNNISAIEITECCKLDNDSYRISFTVSDYSQIGQAEYAYKLEGQDKDWHIIHGENTITIRNIKPGNYNFCVKGKLKNGEWDEKSQASIPLNIEPPVYITWWAKCLYVVLGLCLCIAIFMAYRRHIILKSSLEIKRNSLELEQKKRLDEQDLNNERLRFYTNIAHELRTPLTLILGPLEDLRNDEEMPSKYSNKVRVIHDSALRLLNLINQIMEFRKTETQNRELVISKGNISNLVTEIGLRYKELNRNPDVEFKISVNNIENVYFDADIISTILNNLLSNAMKYTPKGCIILSLNKEDNTVCISVSDTGYGIEEKALPHIYDRYYQAKGKHQASGTGIGLALVKALADLHKGELSVESEVGKGSCFKFTISATYTYPEAKHKATVNDDITIINEIDENETRPVILVIEDNDELREYTASVLSEEYKVIEARNGREGLTLALNCIPNVIVSDIMMPEMDGVAMCREVKKDVRTSHIPVILLTAKDSIQDKEEGYESGADSYLTKPFSAKLLKTRIKNILESRKKLAKLIAEKSTSLSEEDSISDNLPDDTAEKDGTPSLNAIDQRFIEKFNSLIENNFESENADMTFFANNLNMSYPTLYRKIKGLTGMTVNEYIRKIKIRHSAGLLLTGEYNVTEAAFKAGFNSLGHFREAFKEEYGMTPSEYIKTHKK